MRPSKSGNIASWKFSMFEMKERNFSYILESIKSHLFFWVVFHGEISMGRIAHSHNELTSHPDFKPGIDELMDLTNCSVDRMSREDFETLRSHLKDQPDRHNQKSIFVVNSELQFGLLRMMGSILDNDVPVDRGLSYSLDDALEWLRPGQGAELRKIGVEKKLCKASD